MTDLPQLMRTPGSFEASPARAPQETAARAAGRTSGGIGHPPVPTTDEAVGRTSPAIGHTASGRGADRVASPAGRPAPGVAARDADTGDFAQVLTSLLGDAGSEVAEMVEALESLHDLGSEQTDELAVAGWPLPALLALQGGVGGAAPVSDATPDPEDVALDQLVEWLATGAEGAASEEGAVAGGGPEGGQQVTTATVDPVAMLSGAARGGAAGDPSSMAAWVQRLGGTDPATEGVTSRPAGAAETTVRVEPAPTMSDEVDAWQAGIDTRAPGPDATRAAVANRTAELPGAVQRIIDAVEALEKQPPPRQLTVEVGEVRLRVSLEDGQLRLTLLDADADVGDELLRDAREELAQRGYDLGGDGGGQRSGQQGGERGGPGAAAPATQSGGATSSATPAGVLHL